MYPKPNSQEEGHWLETAYFAAKLRVRNSGFPLEITKVAADNALEAGMKLGRERPDKFAAISKFIAYVKTAAYRFALSQKRKRQPPLSFTDVDGDGYWDQTTCADDPTSGPSLPPNVCALVRAKAGELHTGFLDSLRLRFGEGLTLDETAKRLGINKNAFRKWWYQAIAQLRQLIEDACIVDESNSDIFVLLQCILAGESCPASPNP